MSRRPDVSVCIVNWNGRELLRNLLLSLRAAEPGLNLQTVVVDNASTDGSVDALPGEFPEAVLVRNGRNLGFARGNNQAADRATGRYLFFLNNDTVVHPGAIGKLVRFLDEHPNYSAVGPKLIGDDGKPQHTGRKLPTMRALLHQRVMLFPRWTRIFKKEYQDYRYGEFDPEERGEVEQLAAAALMVRPQWFERCGRWDEGFEFGVEDVDLCARLREYGPIYYLPEAQILHLGRISSRANRGYVYTGYECGYARYLAKHHRNRSACLAYKALVTLDMPVRLFIMGSQVVGYVMLRRKESAERTYQRLSAAGEFFFHRLPRFWKS